MSPLILRLLAVHARRDDRHRLDLWHRSCLSRHAAAAHGYVESRPQPARHKREKSARQGTRHFAGRALACPHGGAGLFLRSLVNLNNVDTGFNKENVLRLNIDSSSAGYKADEPREVALDQQIEERVSALPNVKAASFSAFTFHEGSWNSSVVVPGMNIDDNVNVMHNVVGIGYLRDNANSPARRA